MAGASEPGTIAWQDLTVENADDVRAFYEAMAGWRSEPVDMGGYSDFDIIRAGRDAPVAGVCHAGGSNAALPPQWLVYVAVEDPDRCLGACDEQRGAVVDGPRSTGGGRLAVIRDPAGAMLAVFQVTEG